MEINHPGKWLSILDYALYKQISVSSIRRYIKAGRVIYKKKSGKYFIWVKNFEEKVPQTQGEQLKVLKLKIKKLEEENHELRMLIDLYEKRPKKTAEKKLPELPIH